MAKKPMMEDDTMPVMDTGDMPPMEDTAMPMETETMPEEPADMEESMDTETKPSDPRRQAIDIAMALFSAGYLTEDNRSDAAVTIMDYLEGA